MALRPIRLDSGRAWIAAVGAAAANGVAFGTAYTFGTFFESMADEFGSERGSTALLFGVTRLGRKMGVVFLSFGIGGLIGPPAAGAIADATSGRTVPIAVALTVVLLALWSTRPLAAT